MFKAIKTWWNKPSKSERIRELQIERKILTDKFFTDANIVITRTATLKRRHESYADDNPLKLLYLEQLNKHLDDSQKAMLEYSERLDVIDKQLDVLYWGKECSNSFNAK